MKRRKITLIVPAELLERAQYESGGGITETVRKGLELLAATASFRDLRKLRGKLKLKIDLDDLRRDRSW